MWQNLKKEDVMVMQMKNQEYLKAYEDWYALQVKPGRESYVKELIEFYSEKPVQLVVFNRELVHRKNGEYITVLNPLFPGYIFVHRDILYVTKLAKKILHKEFIRPIIFSGAPAKVKPEEMISLFEITNPAGTIVLSRARKQENQIAITRGPLKDMNVKVVFVNEKKRKVKVEFTLFGRAVTMNLGFNLTNLVPHAA